MSGIIRRVLRSFSVFLCLVLVFAALIVGLVLFFNRPPASPPPSIEDGAVLFEIHRGESARSVGRRLEEAGIIRSRYFWYLLSRLEKDYVKTGTYRLEFPATQLAIHAVLVEGRQILNRVTIPEGVTIGKIGRILEEAGICDAAAFAAAAADPAAMDRYRIPAATMEGYLFPETYLFPAAYPPSMVVTAMADTFFRRLGDIVPAGGEPDPEELHRGVILASIIEREYRIDEEAPLMAGVFDNRLRIGMALQSCATVEYVITEIQGRPHPEILYTRDTEIRNPYNTYLYPGLPPGPISNPGEVALRAGFAPKKSDYLYFRLTDPAAGRHYFSRTLDDHIRAGLLYVKGR